MTIEEQFKVVYKIIDQELYDDATDEVRRKLYDFSCWYCTGPIIIGDTVAALFDDSDNFEKPEFYFICKNCCREHGVGPKTMEQ
jgi:hypothetical protein